MNLPKPVEENILALISEKTGSRADRLSCRYVSGGSINEAASVQAAGVHLFVKWNDARRYPGMFEAEAQGLRLLKDPGDALVPEVLGTGQAGQYTWLALEYVESVHHGNDAAEMFAEMLASLHRNTALRFGLDHDNYMGSLRQSNKQHDTWTEFFIHERLLPQLIIARNNGSLSAKDEVLFERLVSKLPDIIPEEVPALVHGDLWSGNYIAGTENRTWLIDPAVAYGHREVDIAMSRLFGGFPARFYQAYHNYYPLEKGWQERVEIFQLYPLLIHVNLFGGGYVNSVKTILNSRLILKH